MTENNSNDKPFYKTIKSFVLRSGRMTESQQQEYESQKDIWCIPITKKELDFEKLFKNANDVIIEIGFGMGHATIGIAKENPNTNYLGIEVHKAGVGRVLREINENNLTNLYIAEHDAVEVLETMVNDESVSGFHIFFPDPWPKKKHHKRRLVQKAFIEKLSSKLKPGGYIYMATDWEPYAEFALEEFYKVETIENPHGGYAPKISWRPQTNFERKGQKANRDINEIYVVKK